MKYLCLAVAIVIMAMSNLCFAEEYKKVSDTEMEISEMVLPNIVVVSLAQLKGMQEQAVNNLSALDVQYDEAKAKLLEAKALADTRVTEAENMGLIIPEPEDGQ